MTRFIGIDGEGLGRSPHRYALLAACDDNDTPLLSLERPDGELSTRECLDGLLSLPQNGIKCFAYSFTYDLTKILKDLPNKSLYELFRPELRFKEGRFHPEPVIWQGYKLNLLATKFSLSKGSRRIVIWDVWKFFQGAFVKALTQWKVPGVDIEAMQAMKEARGEFTSEGWEQIKGYCYSECGALARLVRLLTDAHIKAGFPLKNYFGAGSTASVVLDSMGIKHQRDEGPPAMQYAVASAFFGGRFENSTVGVIPGPVHGWDISSAYPYGTCRLPCLIHGQWKYTRSKQTAYKHRAALINYSLGVNAPPGLSWGPFPFRKKDGTIIYPTAGGSGWVWRDEFQAGERVFPHVEFRGAWVLHSRCKCASPFARLPELYRERLSIGKEGAGIVIKLGMNSCYGKLAQSIGTNPPYQSWIWAGMITSGCRAQILDILGLHSNPADMLMIATDGVYTRANITPPKPISVGTDDLPKPLGGWEGKSVEQGMFAARPGVYFPLNPTDDELQEVRGRGVGKASVLKHWAALVDAQQAGKAGVTLPSVTRFIGAKTAIHPRAGRNGIEYVRSERYGEWVSRPVQLSFDPAPKRALGFEPWQLTADAESTPYTRGLSSPEALELQQAALEAEEQPDVE